MSRKKTPTAKLANRGSWRAKTRPNEPQVEPGTPPCPEWLTGEAREIWDRLVPELVNLGIMAEMNGFAFARYCTYSVLWLQELNRGNVRNVLDFERYANQCLRLENEYGLTPSSRAGLDVQQPQPASKYLKVVK